MIEFDIEEKAWLTILYLDVINDRVNLKEILKCTMEDNVVEKLFNAIPQKMKDNFNNELKFQSNYACKEKIHKDKDIDKIASEILNWPTIKDAYQYLLVRENIKQCRPFYGDPRRYNGIIYL